MMHGNKGRRNAAKSEEGANSHLHVRVQQSKKAAYVRALKDGEKLAEFVLSACEKELAERLKADH